MLGEKIKSARKKKKLTQKQLADLIGKSEITIRKYESNSTTPPFEILLKLTDALNVNINYLMSTTEYDSTQTVVLNNGFFTIDNIKTRHRSINHIANLISYRLPDFDFYSLSDDELDKLLDDSLDYIEFKITKLIKARNR